MNSDRSRTTRTFHSTWAGVPHTGLYLPAVVSYARRRGGPSELPVGVDVMRRDNEEDGHALTKQLLSSRVRTPTKRLNRKRRLSTCERCSNVDVGVDVLRRDNEEGGRVLDQATLVLESEDPNEEVEPEATLVHVREVQQRGWRSGIRCCKAGLVLEPAAPDVPQALPPRVLRGLRGGKDGRSSARLVPTIGLASSLG